MDTREKLLVLALKAYLERGAHNTTFQRLADELGVSQAAIYKYYRSRDDLLVAAIEYAAAKGREFLQEGENPRNKAMERFKHHVRRNLEFCLEDRLHAIAVITLHYFAACVPRVRALHEEINRVRIERFAGYLQQAVHEGAIPEQDVDETASRIHSLLMGEMIKAYLWPKETKLQARLRSAWGAIEKLAG